MKQKDCRYLVLVQGGAKSADHPNCEWVEYCEDIDEAYRWKKEYPASEIFKPVVLELKEL